MAVLRVRWGPWEGLSMAYDSVPLCERCGVPMLFNGNSWVCRRDCALGIAGVRDVLMPAPTWPGDR